MKFKSKLVCVLPLFLSMNCLATADDSVTSETDVPMQHRWYIGGGSASIDEAQASSEKIGTSATYFKLGWEGKKEKGKYDIVFGAGMSGLLFSDKASFSQEVTGGGRGRRTESSSAQSVGAYAELGSYYTLNEHVEFGLLAGIEVAFQSSRTIPLCKDCHEEDIDISQGLYLTPKVNFLLGENKNWALSLGYQKYLGGDVNGTVVVTLGSAF